MILHPVNVAVGFPDTLLTLLETCIQQQKAREQMAEELETVKALHAEAAATVAEAKLAHSAAAEIAGEVCMFRVGE